MVCNPENGVFDPFEVAVTHVVYPVLSSSSSRAVPVRGASTLSGSRERGAYRTDDSPVRSHGPVRVRLHDVVRPTALLRAARRGPVRGERARVAVGMEEARVVDGSVAQAEVEEIGW